MKLTPSDRNAVVRELAQFRDGLSQLTKLNLEFAGILIDANVLISLGWKNQIKFFNNLECEIGGAVNLELVYKDDACEYLVVASISRTLKLKEDSNSIRGISPEELSDVYSGKAPRLAFMRWLYVYTVNDDKLELNSVADLPNSLAEQIENDFRNAARVPRKSFAEELEWQTKKFSPIEEIENCSDLERHLLQLATVITCAFERKSRSSVARLHVLLARVVFWNRNEYGKTSLLKHLRNARVILALAPSVAFSTFNEAAAVLFELLLDCDEYNFVRKDIPALKSLALSLIRAGLPNCARCITEELLEICYGCAEDGHEKKSYDALIDILWETQKEIKKLPATREYGRALQQLLRSMHHMWKNDVAWKSMDMALDLYLREDEDVNPLLSKFAELVKEAGKKYDEDLAGTEDEWKKDLSIAIKNPLVWQAFIYSCYGRPNRVLKAFPKPIASTEEIGKYIPQYQTIMGLPVEEIWKGMSSEPFENFTKELDAIAVSFMKRKKAEDLRLFEINSTDTSVNAIRLCESSVAKEHELLGVAVDGISEDNKTMTPLAMFPFLHTEHKNFKTNVVATIWKCYPWVTNSTCEVKVKLDNCEWDTFYAIMPYYASDKTHLMRGLKMTAKLCGFAHAITKVEDETPVPASITVDKGPLVEEKGHPVELKIDPDIMDTFEQDTYTSEFSRSGFFLHGKFVSKRVIKCLYGDIACVRIKCKRLDFDFDVYIADDKVDKSLKENDPIDVSGWLYIDVVRALVKTKDYIEAHPEGAVLEPMDLGIYPGVPSFVRTEWTEEEMRTLPDEYRNRNWFDYALQYLWLMDGVENVKPCDNNAALISFLVRQNGKTRRFTFFEANEGESADEQTHNTEVLLLTKTKRGNGVNLDWKILPPA